MDIKPLPLLTELNFQMNQIDPYYKLNLSKTFDPTTWNGDSYQKNSRFDEMYQEINLLNPTLVIDAGCGRNIHKEYIKNLVGFDASPFPEADYHFTILDATFETESADAVLCLGSVQFIDKDYIVKNMEKIISWVKPGGLLVMRVVYADDFVTNYWKTYSPNSLSMRCLWNDELRNYITKKHNLEYKIVPWQYQSEIDEKNHNKKYKEYRSTEQVKAKQQCRRLCWTWRKQL